MQQAHRLSGHWLDAHGGLQEIVADLAITDPQMFNQSAC